MAKDKQGKLFVVSACSGAGKTSIVDTYLKKTDKDIKKVITYTSRHLRTREVNGIDYLFISEGEFESRIQKNFFFEWSKAYGNYYGISAKEFECLEAGRSLMVVVDIAGAKTLKKKIPGATLIWIEVASIDELKKRLGLRNSDRPEHVERRLIMANDEIHEIGTNNFFDYIVVNKSFDRAVSDFEKIIESALAL